MSDDHKKTRPGARAPTRASALVVRPLLIFIALFLSIGPVKADEFQKSVKPLLDENCYECHGGKKPKGKVNLAEINTLEQFLAKPALIEKMIRMVDVNDMPPEDGPKLDQKDRQKLLASLKKHLKESTAGKPLATARLHRLNRMQYNNAVRDLFKLNQDVFNLPEKMMTRQVGGKSYLDSHPTQMPARVEVYSQSLQERGGFQDVSAYPKDLRAQHGFDNQADQLTMPPVLLEAFLQLSVSILGSKDFSPQTCGIWKEFFEEPKDKAGLEAEARTRLRPFLTRAFRGPVEKATLDRYVAYTMTSLGKGLAFTDAMKKTASAVLNSPMFLFRHDASEPGGYGLASRLSFLLWGTAPDDKLLKLAESGRLTDPAVLNRTIDEMMADSRIEGFLNAFPGQWMKLEMLFSAVPDPDKFKFFRLEKTQPASLQMVLEPLLLFDTVFIENRPIIEFIKPEFSYRNTFLQKWYAPDLRAGDQERARLEKTLSELRNVQSSILDPARQNIYDARIKASGMKNLLDLKPSAAWNFQGNLSDSVSNLNLKAHGDISFKDGMVVLKNAQLQTEMPLPFDLKEKTLEIRFMLDDSGQPGGGVMAIQGKNGVFDSLSFGGKGSRLWLPGSEGGKRTMPFEASTPEPESREMIHLAMVYKQDGTTTLYRNGEPYGAPGKKSPALTFAGKDASVVFGVDHLAAGGSNHLSMIIDDARLYNRALNSKEVRAASRGGTKFLPPAELNAALSPPQRERIAALEKLIQETESALKKVPRAEDGLRQAMASRSFERVRVDDPRYGGVITSAAVLSMTSAPKRTQPISRGAWLLDVIFNDPPAPPPNDVPPLPQTGDDSQLTIRERFAKHRESPTCASCHSRIDPLGFALENFDVIGQWRDQYENKRPVDASGTLMRQYDFKGIVDFKDTLVKEEKRFAKAFSAHLLRFALSRELSPAESLVVDDIVQKTAQEGYRLKSIIREVILTDGFLQKPARKS